MYKQNESLLKILKNKRIALVGPSPHLIGSAIGDQIDQYDLICRVNEVHPTGYEKDYGDRTDIVFHNCGTRFIDTFGDRLVTKSIISKYLKCVICPCVKSQGSDNWRTWPGEYQSPVTTNFQKINIFNIPFYWIGMNNYRYIYDLFGTEPNAGQTAIVMLLEHQVAELLITGFSFYAQGNTPSLSHRPGHTNKGLEQELIGDPGHAQSPQRRCFKEKIFRPFKNKIKVDSYLNGLLDLNHKNVLDIG